MIGFAIILSMALVALIMFLTISIGGTLVLLHEGKRYVKSQGGTHGSEPT